MLRHFALAALLSVPGIAQEKPGVPPSTAPQFNLPRPEYLAKPPAANPPLKVPDAWTQAFLDTLLDSYRPTRQARWTELVRQCPASEYNGALRAFSHTDKSGFRGAFTWEWETLWEHWTERFPAEAMKAGEHMNRDGNLKGLPRSILRSWATVDPLGARTWFEAQPKERKDDPELHVSLIAGWARRDLKAATKYALEVAANGSHLLDLSVTRLRDEAHRAGLLPGAEAWFDSLPESTELGSPKTVAASHVAWLMGNGTVEEEMRFLSRLKEPALYQEKRISETATNLAASQMFKLGIEWACSLPVNPVKKTFDGVPVLAERWAEKEPKLFSEWLIANRENPAIDFALLGLVRHLAKRDITDARKWAGQINNPAAKELVSKVIDE
jgi:hypothetical protein